MRSVVKGRRRDKDHRDTGQPRTVRGQSIRKMNRVNTFSSDSSMTIHLSVTCSTVRRASNVSPQNQTRHMKSLLHPIAADEVYGRKPNRSQRVHPAQCIIAIVPSHEAVCTPYERRIPYLQSSRISRRFFSIHAGWSVSIPDSPFESPGADAFCSYEVFRGLIGYEIGANRVIRRNVYLLGEGEVRKPRDLTGT